MSGLRSNENPSSRGLKGVRILVTRPAHQAGELCRLIEKAGGIAVKFPVLEIVPNEMSGFARDCLRRLQQFDWVIFTSRNAVNFAVSANDGKMLDLNKVRVAAIGRATADTLINKGGRVDLLPSAGFNSEALLAAPALQQMAGLSCLIIRGQGGRELLGATLRERGAAIKYLEVYRRTKPVVDRRPIVDLLQQRRLDVVTVTSVEALYNLIDLLEKDIKTTLLRVPLVVISDRIKKIAAQIGFDTIAVSANPSDTEIITTMTALINEDNSGRIE